MNSSAVHVGQKGSQYFQEAAMLRWCLELNKKDFEFASQGGRINYLMDANIVRFFISPEEESRHVTPFRNSGETDYADATALITAEFLFSRSLAGQKHGPAFIAPAHGDEIGGIIDAIARESRDINLDGLEKLQKEKIALLKKLISDFDSHKLRRDQAAEKLKQLVPEVARVLLKGGLQWAIQLRRLYDDDLLRPLGLHPAATAKIMDPNPAEVRIWSDRIRAHRKHSNDGDRERIRRDAEALVQTMLLDEEARNERADENALYVLVTADHSILDAYTEWYWAGERLENQRFVLRAPLQYAPILNAYEMPNDIESSKLSERAAQALDSLFSNLQAADSGFVDKLMWYRLISKNSGALIQSLEQFYGVNPLEFGRDDAPRFSDIRELWHESFRSGVVLNARLMNNRREEFVFLAEHLRENVDLRKEICDHQARTLETIQARHTAFNSKLNLRLLLNGPALGRKPRAVVMIDVRFSGLDNLPLEHVLKRAADGDMAFVSSVDRELSKGDASAFFLAACIAFRCGHWSAAVLFAHRAIERINFESGPEDDLREATYLHASALRYALAASALGDEDRLGEVTSAVSELRAMEDACRASDDAFGALRMHCENISLRLVRAYYRWASGLRTPENEIDELSRTNRDLVFASETLDRLSGLKAAPSSAAVIALDRQIASNFISFAVLTGFIGPEIPELRPLAKPSDDQLARAIQRFRELEGGDGDPDILVMSAELRISEYLLGTTNTSKSAEDIDRLNVMIADNASSLVLDREEVSRFAGMLNQLVGIERARSESTTLVC